MLPKGKMEPEPTPIPGAEVDPVSEEKHVHLTHQKQRLTGGRLKNHSLSCHPITAFLGPLTAELICNSLIFNEIENLLI